MVIFLINPASDAQHDYNICQHQQMKPHCRNCCFDNDFSEISNKQIHWIGQKQALYPIAVIIDGIEDCRHIHQQLRKYIPEILNISKKHE